MNYRNHFASLLLAAFAIPANAEEIDISGNNTSSNYITYNQAFSIGPGKSVDVKMARYCYFSSKITGSGTLNLYAGGERCYLGTEKGKEWPDWNSYRGDIHIYPFKENSPSAGFWGVVLAHGGKSFSPENIEADVKAGKVNKSMANNSVTLHEGATMCCEANTAGAGFRIGELHTEPGSNIIGYMKKNTRAAYFLIGFLGTDASLDGTIAPPDYSDTHPLGIIKEGTGTYTITGNNNFLSASLRLLEGRVEVANDADEARTKKLRGALGAMSDATKPVAYVFGKGTLGGSGSIGGTVDNYGTVEPGSYATLTIQNYATPSKSAHLYVHPASVLRFNVATPGVHDRIVVGGTVKYSNMMEDFSDSDKMPQVQVVYDPATVKVGDEYVLLTAKAKDQSAGAWHFELQQPEHYTWQLDEREDGEGYSLVLRLTSLEDPSGNTDDPDPDDPTKKDVMGAFYDDGISDASDYTTLRKYADQNRVFIGTAISTWKNDITNGSLPETQEIGNQFNMLVAENEMKFDALQPNQGEFSYWAADNLVNFAASHKMKVRGHCLVWHQQQPQWVSSDGKKNDKNWSRQQALDILKSHITNVLTHFKGKVDEWDVVNECLDDDQSVIRTSPDAYTLRQNVWLRAIGEDYIDSAFVFARRADPGAQLFLNDYDVEHQGRAKAVAFYNLAMRLKARNIPIDGVGLQCHFSVGSVDSVKLASTIQRFGQEGMKCIITELDMGVTSTSQQQLEEQARLYRVITDIVLNNANCPDMVIWGLKDNDSWRSGSSPLLYTAALEKKTAWYAVRSALRHRTLVTAINDINADGGSAHESDPGSSAAADGSRSVRGVFALDGRQIRSLALAPGIYVINGRKYVR